MNDPVQLARAALVFLERVPLEGKEVAAYCDVNNWLQQIASSVPAPAPEENSEKDNSTVDEGGE